jgi:hypothetical protein
LRNNPGHENKPGFPPLVSYAVGNAIQDAIDNAVDNAVGNAIDVLAHVFVVDSYDLDLADVRVDNNIARAHDSSDDGTTDRGRDDYEVRGTNAIGRRD